MEGLLDGVKVTSLGLMAAVTWQLARSSIVDPVAAAMALVSALLLFRFKVDSTGPVLEGAGITLSNSPI